MGRSEAEAHRLMLQARLLDRPTRRFLGDVGLAPGMTVLDVGSGVGDVAFAAADLVGPTGRVIGVDANPTIVETARARAQAEDRENVTFVAGDCRTILGYLQASPAGVNRATWEWQIGAFASAGIPTAMVAPLYRAFLAAGL